MGEINVTVREKGFRAVVASPSAQRPPAAVIVDSGKPRVWIIDDPENGEKLYCFHCPACGWGHSFRVGGPNSPRWTFEGSLQLPTFRPSLRYLSGNCCHLTMTAGMIKFHEDSKHALAGRTVPCPEVED